MAGGPGALCDQTPSWFCAVKESSGLVAGSTGYITAISHGAMAVPLLRGGSPSCRRLSNWSDGPGGDWGDDFKRGQKGLGGGKTAVDRFIKIKILKYKTAII